MSPRPRKVTDDDIFEATQRAMSRLAPTDLTLAAIGAEAGVTAGALVHRFGSKRALLLALAERAGGSADELFAALLEEHRSPLAALRAYAGCLSGLAPSPAALARNLAYLQIDLTDPDFRTHLRAHAESTRRALRRILAAAVSESELARSVDPDTLGRAVETTLAGSLLTWAHYQEGPAEDWLRHDLDALLEPYRAPKKPRG